MKKKFLIGATVLAMFLSVSLLIFSVYSAVSQTLAVKNTISFAGGDEGLNFRITGEVTGAKRVGSDDNNPEISTVWDYDYDDMSGSPFYEWNVGNITFVTEDKNKDDIAILYTFEISNLSTYTDINASILGPNNIPEGLIKTTYAYTGSEPVEGASVIVPKTEKGIIKLKLSLERIEDFSCNADINFEIKMEKAN